MEKKNITLSVALAVYNEAANITECLASVKDIADEIIIVDGGSTDDTVALAKKFDATVISTDNPPIFHINKQKALDACHGSWILQLDADEVVTDALKKEIKEVIQKNTSDTNGYYIPRKNYFWGHVMKKGGQYPDYVIRLVKRGKATFPCQSVHEQITIDGGIGYLKEPMLHYSYRTTADYWKKASAYTTLAASDLQKKRVPKTVGNWFLYTIIKPLYTFMNIFIRHKGFVDGWYGLVFAYWSGLSYAITWKKYVKSKMND